MSTSTHPRRRSRPRRPCRRSLQDPPPSPAGRITLVASWGPSLINFREALIRQFLQRDYDVATFAPQTDAGTAGKLRDLGAHPRGLPLQRRRMASPGDLLAVALLMWHLRRSRVTDVVVPYTIKPILLTGLAHRLIRSRARFVAMFTGLGFLHRIGDGAGARIVLAALRFALARASAVIVQHDADRQWLRSHDVLPQRTPIAEVPGSGVDTEHFTPEPFREQGAPILLYLGRMVPEKGVLAFCDYASRATFEARWVAAGPFEDRDDRQRLRLLMQDAGVDYLGATKDVRPYLAAARAIVLPTTYGEGVPRVLQEALAAGRPVVASDAPGCRVAVQDGREGWLINPDDHASALAVLERLCRDIEVARAVGAAGRDRAVAVFDARRVARLTADAILGTSPTS